ncbi:hypothetical protein Bca4012_099372 [Brassica carinata]
MERVIQNPSNLCKAPTPKGEQQLKVLPQRLVLRKLRISRRWDDQRFRRREDVTTVENRVTSRRNAITFGEK